MLELNITSPYVDYRVDTSTCTMGIGNGQPYARVDLNPMPVESTLSPSQKLRIWPKFNIFVTDRMQKNISILCTVDT